MLHILLHDKLCSRYILLISAHVKDIHIMFLLQKCRSKFRAKVYPIQMAENEINVHLESVACWCWSNVYNMLSETESKSAIIRHKDEKKKNVQFVVRNLACRKKCKQLVVFAMYVGTLKTVNRWSVITKTWS